MNENLALSSRHPEPKDLLNLARERLGKKKSQRILDHCKECPECADSLLEAVREHAPEQEKLPLSWWNWASIVLFFVALAAVVLAVVWFLRSAARTAPFEPPPLEAQRGP